MQFDENITTPPLISILHREHAKYLNEKVKKAVSKLNRHSPLLVEI